MSSEGVAWFVAGLASPSIAVYYMREYKFEGTPRAREVLNP